MRSSGSNVRGTGAPVSLCSGAENARAIKGGATGAAAGALVARSGDAPPPVSSMWEALHSSRELEECGFTTYFLLVDCRNSHFFVTYDWIFLLLITNIFVDLGSSEPYEYS